MLNEGLDESQAGITTVEEILPWKPRQCLFLCMFVIDAVFCFKSLEEHKHRSCIN